jgi:uncharacterized protein (UPF0548 family)
MADWRLGRGWSEREVRRHLESLATAERNFADDPDQLDASPDWLKYSSEAVVGRERPGPPLPEGPFIRGGTAMTNYQFSDERIVIPHFDESTPLHCRRILLEMRAFRFLRFLGGVIIGAIRSESVGEKTVFGYRYDTLEGHIERGSEWVLLSKDHKSGLIRFRISASWLPGDFPTWWSGLGFRLVGRHYQQKWHRRAHVLMGRAVGSIGSSHSRSASNGEDYSRPEVVFERVKNHA